MANRSIIELLDDMHLSSQSTFLDYYYAMQANNISYANTILNNHPELQNQIINAQNINYLINGVNERELQPKTDVDYYLDDLLNQFQTMINNTRIMGQFDSGLQYYPHNFVYYQGKGYYAFSQPPIGTLPTNTQYWLEYDIKGLQGYGGINLNLRFNWDSTLDYKVGDLVIYKNRVWYAVADNTNTVPNLNHYPWVIISLPQMPNRTPIQKTAPISGYSEGDFWFQITEGDEVITTTWGIRQPETTPRFSSGAFTIGTNIYVVGGTLANFAPSKANEMYDTSTGTWSQKADMTSDRTRFGYFTIGDIGYVVGGLTDDGVITDKVESYDPATNTWTTKASLPIKLITEAISDGTYGYVFGGVNENGEIVSNSYRYDPTTDEWTAITNKPTPTRGHGLVYADGFIYAMGGINNLEETIGNVEVYDIATQTFSTKEDMITPRSYMGVFHKSGIIYAIGGLNNDWYSLDINEKFTIVDNKWEADMPMNYPRSSLTTAVTGNKAYAIGGINIGTSAVNGYNEQYGITDVPSSFEMTINTTLGGTKDFEVRTLSNTTNSFYIDWGDGTESSIISTAGIPIDHTYTEDGEYVIKIIGNSTGLGFSGNKNLKSVDKCTLALVNIESMFSGCTNLISIPDGIFDNSPTLANANSVFKDCENLSIIPSGLFDQNINITSFINTFSNSGITSIPNGLFNRNNLVTTFEDCFSNCSKIIVIPKSLFDYNISVTSFKACFSFCKSLTTIPTGLFSNNSYCTNYEGTFSECSSLSSLSEDIFKNSVGAKSLSNLFANCSSLATLPEGLFKDTINATNYSNVFSGTNITSLPDYTFNGQNAQFTLPSGIKTIGNYALKGLQFVAQYFKNNTTIESIGNNNFAKGGTWDEMFSGATSLVTLGIQDMTGVSSLLNTFNGCSKLANMGGFMDESNNPTLTADLDLSSTSVLTQSSLQNIKKSLVTMTPTTTRTLTLTSTSLGLLTDAEKFAIINKYWLLPGWTKPTVTSSLAQQIVQELYGNSNTSSIYKYETSLYYKVDLTNKSTGAVINSYYVDKSTGMVYLVGNEPIKEYRINGTIGTQTTAKDYYVSKGSNNDTSGAALRSWIITNSAKNINIYNTANLTSLATTFKNCTTLTNITLDNTKNVTSFVEAFRGCENLKTVKCDTDNATSLELMFSGCTNLTSFSGTSSSLNTQKVTSMRRMFYNCISMTSYPTFSNTTKVTTTEEMFSQNGAMVTAPTMNMTAVTNASKMFADCQKLKTVNLSNVGNIQNASYMFSWCSALTSIGSLTFTNCTNATGMFQYTGFTSVPSTVKLTKATNMSYIFAGCPSLTTIVGGFFPSTVQNVSNAFLDCTKLTTLPSNVTTVFGSNSALTNVSSLFSGCTNLKTIGTHTINTYNADTNVITTNTTALNNQIFKNCPNITNMSSICEGCTSLGNNTDFPQGLFYWCPKVTDISYAFSGCTSLANPATYALNSILFIKNTNLVNISHLFENAGGSSFNIFENFGYSEGGVVYQEASLLFPNSTKIQDASYCFAGVKFTTSNASMTIPFVWKSTVLKNVEGYYSGITQRWVYDIDGHNNTYGFAHLNTLCPALQNCSKMFYGCTNLISEGLPFVTAAQKITTLTNHAQVFTNCTNLSDYSSIPSGWK